MWGGSRPTASDSVYHTLLGRSFATLRSAQDDSGCCAATLHASPSHVSRLTSHVSRLTSHVSRVPTHVSRFSAHLSCVMSHVSRLTSHVSRLTSHVSRLTSHATRLTLVSYLCSNGHPMHGKRIICLQQ